MQITLPRWVALLVATLALVGCAALPTDAPRTLGATLQVRDNLAETCQLSFTSAPAGEALTLHTGTDQRGVYSVTLLGSDDMLMRAAYTVAPEQEPVIWRDNYIDRCLIRFLAQLGQAWLHPWYYERLAAGEATNENQELRATLLGGEGEQVVLELTALDFADRLATLGPVSSSSAPPAPAAGETDCGARLATNLGGQRLNVRAEPSTSAAVIAKLPEGAEVRHRCTTLDAGGRVWALIAATVEGAQVEGWVSEEFLSVP